MPHEASNDACETEAANRGAVSVVSQMADALVASVTASIQSAAAALAAEVDGDTQGSESTSSRLQRAVQLRLADTHSDLFSVGVTRPSKKRLRDALEASVDAKTERLWRPTRPKLALEIAAVLQQGVGLVQVPAEKAESCELPMKIFAKQVAASLAKGLLGRDASEKSLVYAVNEVCAAVVSEVETICGADGTKCGVVHLHGCTDAAWTGTSARGSGIAMDANGKERVLAAIERVKERLSQPLKLCKLPR